MKKEKKKTKQTELEELVGLHVRIRKDLWIKLKTEAAQARIPMAKMIEQLINK